MLSKLLHVFVEKNRKGVRLPKYSRNQIPVTPAKYAHQGALSRLFAGFSHVIITSLLILLLLMSCFWFVVLSHLFAQQN